MAVRETSPQEEHKLAELALKIDQAMSEHAPAGWKGDETREKQVLNALFPIMDTCGDAAIFFPSSSGLPSRE